ncbi:MAG: hypothetical protein DRN30_05905 [Thermoplasmata archaeon]|nr:MAG: hypothetical protein DRN30_05905 [Thermoplasmata archaeon]
MTKGIFGSIIFIGIVSAVFGVMAPLHEIWHWLAAFLQGVDATMAWDVTYMDTSQAGLFIGYAGMYGEIITLGLIFFKLVQKKHFAWATFFLGYSTSFIIAILLVIFTDFLPIDLEVMLGNCNKVAVYGVFIVWVGLYGLVLLGQYLTVWEFRGEFLGIGSSNRSRRLVEGVKRIKKEHEDAEIRENRYKPLTLVQ